MLLTLVTLSLFGDIAPPFPSKRPVLAQCTADTDCVLSTFQGCCGGCCGVAPHAVLRGVNESARAHCEVKECAMPDCSAVRCKQPPDPNSFVAACQAGSCVAVPKTAAPAQCRVNQDCSVVTAAPPAGASCHQSACGCCPVTQAAPVDAVVPLQKKTEPKNPAGKPNFGLSTGGPTPLAQPNCSPCPAPAGGSALCQSGRCVLEEAPRPRPRPPG